MDTKAIMACGFLFLGGIALVILSNLIGSSLWLALSLLFSFIWAVPLMICAWKGAFPHTDTEEQLDSTHHSKEDDHEHT